MVVNRLIGDRVSNFNCYIIGYIISRAGFSGEKDLKVYNFIQSNGESSFNRH